ncbi:hypothetical protein BaRGS_00016181 [Batillaria attramentaria]|uniref:Uncharacterized protein n=1 Tax=Batillaria attramentaria TaxID=370345 RepID=A0ABD0KZ90_9CAEN
MLSTADESNSSSRSVCDIKPGVIQRSHQGPKVPRRVHSASSQTMLTFMQLSEISSFVCVYKISSSLGRNTTEHLVCAKDSIFNKKSSSLRSNPIRGLKSYRSNTSGGHAAKKEHVPLIPEGWYMTNRL